MSLPHDDERLTDDRSATAVAYDWAGRVTSISLEMALPGLFGYWLDRWLGTLPLCVSLGAILGLTLSLRHLMALAGAMNRKTSRRERRSE